MGWMIGIALTVVGLINRDSFMLIAASIFALTGAVAAVAVNIGKLGKGENQGEN